MDVEIFGGFYAGGKERELEYARTKESKITFNKDNPRFIQMSVEDCYNDAKLQSILEPFIGTPEVSLRNSYDHLVDTSQLSLMDRALKQCRIVCDNLGTPELPSSNWFTRTGSHKDRAMFEWEVKGLHRDMSKLGGLKKIREIMKLSS